MSEGLVPPESSATWTVKPVPHPWADVGWNWATAVWIRCASWDLASRDRYADKRPIPAHLKQPGWKFGGGR